jgi:hypothetical protein
MPDLRNITPNSLLVIRDAREARMQHATETIRFSLRGRFGVLDIQQGWASCDWSTRTIHECDKAQIETEG